MSHTTMQEPNQQPAIAWTLPAQAAVTLAAAGPQVLWVHEGRVWLTREASSAAPDSDVWLTAGQRHALPAGSRWIAEAWPAAQLSVVVAPQPHGRLVPRRGLASALRAWWSSLPRAAHALAHGA